MAALFPLATRHVDSTETTHLDNFNHLIAAKYSLGNSLFPRGVAIDPSTKRVYITNAGLNRSCVLIFSEAGKYLKHFTVKKLRDPCGIAIHRDNIYVTDTWEHYVFHLKVAVSISLVARIGGIGAGIRQFNYPRQLTVSTNGDVFITDCFNDRIQILDYDLRYQRHISHHSLSLPCDVKLTSNEIYVLCDRSNPCLHVFSYSGEKIRSLVTSGDVGMQIANPFSFCLDSNENLYIVDCEDHQVKIFSKEGTLLDTVGEKGHGLGKFYFPTGIALIDNFKLVVVSQNLEKALQLFY